MYDQELEKELHAIRRSIEDVQTNVFSMRNAVDNMNISLILAMVFFAVAILAITFI